MKRAQNVKSDVQVLWLLGGWVQLSPTITRRLRWNLMYWLLANPKVTAQSESCPTYTSSGHWNIERNEEKFNLWGRLEWRYTWEKQCVHLRSGPFFLLSLLKPCCCPFLGICLFITSDESFLQFRQICISVSFQVFKSICKGAMCKLE